MKKNVLSRRNVVAGALVGFSFLAASAGQAATTVTVWCWDKNFNGATMKEAGERYAKMHPDVTINVVDFAKPDMEQKLQAQLASGTTDGLPDIVLIEDYGAQKYLQSFTNAFEPLSDSKAIDYKTFANYKVALSTVGDKTYSLPFDSGDSAMFYRSDYLTQAGYKAEDLNNITWDKLIEIGKAVEAKTGHKMLDLDLNDVGLVRIMMQSAGGWYFTPDANQQLMALFSKLFSQNMQRFYNPAFISPSQVGPNIPAASHLARLRPPLLVSGWLARLKPTQINLENGVLPIRRALMAWKVL